MVHIIYIKRQNYLIVKPHSGSYTFTHENKDINSDGIFKVQWIETILKMSTYNEIY